jgi:hypothetical protein
LKFKHLKVAAPSGTRLEGKSAQSRLGCQPQKRLQQAAPSFGDADEIIQEWSQTGEAGKND